ncbi:phage shock protein operon transcriptional activator [Candidatus Marimicrobium litorale]|nr:phage shock protein operon transcriptional activator [Candidatus Marimicrobium litorale]
MRKPNRMIGRSTALAGALDQLSLLAGIERPVLLMGERGTGKELAAERLHFLSARWEAPLIRINCAALSDALLDSELFGHEAGAFTGAKQRRKGRFERADGGTLFLDEIASLSSGVQEKILRLVEYGEFERLGGQETLQVDVRIIGASNVDLHQLVLEQRFRADLLDRLSFDVVHLPPLRHRADDIEELAEHFAVQLCAELGWKLFPGFSPEALALLQSQPWPGNVRELRSTVERSLFRWGDPETPVDKLVLDPFRSPYAEELPTQTQDTRETDGAIVDFHSQISTLEQTLLQRALEENGGIQRAAAETLGLSYNQMRSLVRKYKLSSRRRRRTVST